MAFGDVLAGLAEASHTHQTNLLKMDYEKKRELAQMYGKLAESQDYPAEARTEFLKRALQIHTMESGKKLPKEWENMQLTVQPPTGPQKEQPQGPSTGAAGLPLDDQSEFNLPAPTPPPRTQSAFAPMSFEDRLAQLGSTEQVKADIDVTKAGRTKAAELGVINAPANLNARVTEDREKTLVPVPPQLQAGLGERTMPSTLVSATQLATDNPPPPIPPPTPHTVPTEEGVMQYNPKTGLYDIRVGSPVERTIDPSLAGMRAVNLENLTDAAPGQLIFTKSGLPVPPEKVGDTTTARLSGFQDAHQQVQVVKESLKKLGDTGAIKGWVQREGIYWPVVQDGISAEAAGAVAETMRLVNSYLYAVSGKQINEQEMARIARTAPNIVFTSKANDVIMKGFDDFLLRSERNYLRTRGWSYKPETPVGAGGVGGTGGVGGGTPLAPPAPLPRRGDKKPYNGANYTFDGTVWLKDK